jgi:hypothetical protein
VQSLNPYGFKDFFWNYSGERASWTSHHGHRGTAKDDDNSIKTVFSYKDLFKCIFN